LSTDLLRQRFQTLLEGQYAIGRELGRGGMATVYLAKDLRHDRQVAIKLLQPELTTAVTAERFLREIQITAKLQHPHILTLIDSGAKDGLVYYVMPHVEGESLRDRLIWEKQLPIERAVQIARQVAGALQHAHERGVIHRDIKPENILLSGGQAILADFGIARAVRESGQQVITQVGLPLGTPAYMSPEQASGQDDIDARSDLYSLGCVFFEMLAGRPPFVAPTVSKVLQMHLTEPPPSACACRTAAPVEMDALLARALAKDRSKRFQTAQDFSDALGVIEATETLERATPPSARRVSAPQPAVAVATAYGSTPSTLKRLLVVGGVIGALVLGWLAFDAARPSATPPPRSTNPAVVPAAGETPFLASIGVKPLDAIGDSASRMLSAGITEEVSAQLTKIRQLKVISRTTMEAVKAKGWTTREIADSLGIQYLLEGSVHQVGRQLAVTLQLINATTDAHLWGESLRQPLRDILMLRQEIARQAVEALAVRVPGLQVMGPDAGSRNPEAEQARAHGVELQDSGDEERLDEAIRSFERALSLDSTYAAAAAELSDALRYYIDLGFGTKRDPYQALAQSLRWAERAVRLDPNLALGWAARGSARLEAGVRPDLALADMDRAVALAPADGNIRVGRGIALARANRHEEALREMEAAAALDPLSAPARGGGLAVTALAARRFEIAVREARLAALRDPSFPGWRVVEALGALFAGDPGRCLEMNLDPFTPVTAICLHQRGDTARAQALIDSLVARSEKQSLAIYTLGFIGAYYAVLGQPARAIEWLEKGYALSPAAFDRRLLQSPLFDRVRDDPTFQRGLAAITARVRARFSGGRS
jgi:serine/threonine-protein kinase